MKIQKDISYLGKAVLISSALFLSAQAFSHSHDSTESPLSEIEKNAAVGMFDDVNVKDRTLNDWDGEWQSVYPYLQKGELDEVLKSKAANDGGKTFEYFKEYYSKGYATEVDSINIKNGVMEFKIGSQSNSCKYKYSGHQILTYKSGKKGVRYQFECTDSNSQAPKYVQFSDHIIAPRKAEHFHIFMGNSSHEELLKEMVNWPTYYPSNLNSDEIAHEMLYH